MVRGGEVRVQEIPRVIAHGLLSPRGKPDTRPPREHPGDALSRDSPGWQGGTVTIPTEPTPPRDAADTPHAPRHLQPGDGWVECTCGRRHWGLAGAAGLLVARRGEDGRVSHVLLQHRAPWSDQGGTWGVPGGAIHPDETPEQGALREAHEEAGVDPALVTIVGDQVLEHGPWRYTTVLAEVVPGAHLEARATDAESLEIAWVAVGDVLSLPLLEAFRDAWPELMSRYVEVA
jgi:septum formation protein